MKLMINSQKIYDIIKSTEHRHFDIPDQAYRKSTLHSKITVDAIIDILKELNDPEYLTNETIDHIKIINNILTTWKQKL